MPTPDDIRHITGRACAPAPIGISLHKFVGSMGQLQGLVTNCRNKNRPSYNYAIEGCNWQVLVEEQDTAFAIPFPVCPVPPVPVCPPTYPPCWDGTTILDPLLPTQNPNCFVISVALVVGINTTDLCSDTLYAYSEEQLRCLAYQLYLITQAHPLITVDPQHIFPYGDELPDFPICDLIDYINDVVILPPPNYSPLCDQIKAFPAGVAVSVLGVDALGNCVLSTNTSVTGTPIVPVDTLTANITSSGIAGHTIQVDVIVSPALGNALTVTPLGLFVAPPVAPPTTVTVVNNTTLGQLEVTVNGVQANIPLTPLFDATGLVLLGYIFV